MKEAATAGEEGEERKEAEELKAVKNCDEKAEEEKNVSDEDWAKTVVEKEKKEETEPKGVKEVEDKVGKRNPESMAAKEEERQDWRNYDQNASSNHHALKSESAEANEKEKRSVKKEKEIEKNERNDSKQYGVCAAVEVSVDVKRKNVAKTQLHDCVHHHDDESLQTHSAVVAVIQDDTENEASF